MRAKSWLNAASGDALARISRLASIAKRVGARVESRLGARHWFESRRVELFFFTFFLPRAGATHFRFALAWFIFLYLTTFCAIQEAALWRPTQFRDANKPRGVEISREREEEKIITLNQKIVTNYIFAESDKNKMLMPWWVCLFVRMSCRKKEGKKEQKQQNKPRHEPRGVGLIMQWVLRANVDTCVLHGSQMEWDFLLMERTFDLMELCRNVYVCVWNMLNKLLVGNCVDFLCREIAFPLFLHSGQHLCNVPFGYIWWQC